MNGLQLAEIQKEIEKQLKEQRHELIEEISRGCEHTDSTEVVCGKMIANAIAISTRISASMLFDLLIDVGIVKPCSDDELRKRNFSIIKQEE